MFVLISFMFQASKGTVKAAANFKASADAEVLHKAMKGIGKRPACICCHKEASFWCV